MWSTLSIISILSLIYKVSCQDGDCTTNPNGLLSCGPYFYPTGDQSQDNSFINFGEENATHFYLNMVVTGDNWLGFAFGNSHYPDGCTPDATCSGTVGLSGCVYPDTADVGCETVGADAIIFGNYGGELDLAIQEWTLDGWSTGSLHSAQDLSLIQPVFSQNVVLDGSRVWQYSVNSLRPYDPRGDPWYDIFSYALPYPLGGDFCWLWAMGSSISFPSDPDTYGYQCIDFGGTTLGPTPSPSYGPTPGPTEDPTIKPTKAPTVRGATAKPTDSPTKEPTLTPTDPTPGPSRDPTPSPTPGPTVQEGDPTKAPTLKPTPAPSEIPTKEPTARPSEAPTRPGETKKPTPSVRL